MEKKAPPAKRQDFNWQPMVLLVLFALLLNSLFQLFSQGNIPEISYSEFKEKAGNGRISEVVFDGEVITGTFKSIEAKESAGDAPKEEQPAQPQEKEKFRTIIPPYEDPDLPELFAKEKISVTARPQESSLIWTVLIYLLPWLFIVGVFLYTSSKIRGGMGGAAGPFGFGKSKARLYRKTREEVTFDRVAGLENAKMELQEIIEFLKNPGKFQALGGELPKGIMLIGPPGTGKTLLAKATAGEADVPFFSISGSEFIEMFVGVGASRVRDMFVNAKKSSPSIIFIDEIDSIGRVRGTGLGGGHDEREQTLNQILSEMDGFSPKDPVVVIAATNRPDVLDPALVRPGRFDRRITLDFPQKEARLQILRLHCSKIQLAEKVDLEKIAAATVGFSGADLHNLVNEAALLAARQGKNAVDDEDFEQGRDKIMLGLEREEHLSEKEKKNIAYHEAGHALVALLSPNADPLKKVSIIPRGQTLGATQQLPEEDRHNFGRPYLFAKLSIMLGGRAAEILVFDEKTSGAGDDLKKATQLAKRMICQWGMNEKLGPAVFSQGEPHPFLGRELTQEKNFSEQTARIIDEEIISLLQAAQATAMEILKKNREKLDTLAKKLIESESLTDREIEKLLNQEKGQRRRERDL